MLRDKLIPQLQGRLQEYLSLNVYGEDKVFIALENHGELTECSTFFNLLPRLNNLGTEPMVFTELGPIAMNALTEINSK